MSMTAIIGVCPECGGLGVEMGKPGPYRPRESIECPSCGEERPLTFQALDREQIRALLDSGEFPVPDDRTGAALKSEGVWRARCCQVRLRFLEVGSDWIADRQTALASEIGEINRLYTWLRRADWERRREDREMGEDERERVIRFVEILQEKPEVADYSRLPFGFFRSMAIIAEHHLNHPALALDVTQLGLAVGRVTDRQRQKVEARIDRLERKVAR